MVVLYCFISFIVGAMLMLFAMAMAAMAKEREPRNKVRFYVARNKNGILNVYLNKPLRNKPFGYWYQNEYDEYNNVYIWKASRLASNEYISYLGLNPKDFKNLKWEDEPVEVYINLED